MKILLATENPHKAREMAPLLAGLGVELLTFKDFPGLKAAVEDGTTLEENARKKAVGPAKEVGIYTLADDTGLEVEALNGGPGVYSARYAGPECRFEDNIHKLLGELKGVPRAGRGARFRTVVAMASPAGEVRTVEGRLDGSICESPAGGNGFGYDPIFFVTEAGRTLAEMTLEEKNALSHRARAMRAALPMIKELAGARS